MLNRNEDQTESEWKGGKTRVRKARNKFCKGLEN